MTATLSKVAPRAAKVLFENSRVRVLRIRLKKGETLPMHSHPPNFVYALRSTNFRSIPSRGRARRVKMSKGESGYSSGSTHAVESLSDSVILQIELKR
ncbi:MAG: hypothetical protein LYZ70_03760 [Nitrososphaerales archaeon]|nr:hypothetical protein [Nitrososphaerales archaeon]